MGRIKGLVFDKDGTLFDFTATWGGWTQGLIATEAGGDNGRRDDLARALGFDLASEQFLPGSVVIAQPTDRVAQAILPFVTGGSLSDLIARMDARSAASPQVPVAPLAPLLGDLRARGLRLGLATNDSEAPARAHLASAGISGLFDFVAGYDSGHGGKPAAGQLLAFARACGLEPASCAMVGDSLHDLTAARAAGMLAVGVLTGPARREALAPEADVVLPSIAGLGAWLDGLG